jgi:pimeloyl-ACP methyl ester carboxylesterase
MISPHHTLLAVGTSLLIGFCVPAVWAQSPSDTLTCAPLNEFPPDTLWTDPSPHHCGFVAVNGIKLNYLDWGGHGPVVILLAGNGDSAHGFDDLAPRLTDRFHVLGLTRRGTGASEHPAGGYTVAQTTDDLLDFMDALSIKQAYLIGHSIAGAEITRLAGDHPERVLGLVYIDALPDWRGLDEVQAKDPIPRPRTDDDFTSYDHYRRWLHHYFYGYWTPALDAELHYLNASPEATKALEDDAMRVPPDYSKVHAPTLSLVAIRTIRNRYPWLASRDDSVQVREAQSYLDTVLNPWDKARAERFEKEIPHGRIVYMEADHHMHDSNLDQVVEEIRAFLK